MTASLRSSEQSSDLDEVLRNATRGPRGSDYADLSRRIKAAGLMERRRRYYVVAITLVVALFFGGWTAVVLIGDSWYQLLAAAGLAVVFGQLGFIGHDAGHGQIFATRSANRVVGLLVGNLAIGLGYGWWVSKHNRHHAHPNDKDKDPDVGVGALVFNADQSRQRTGFLGFLTRWQAYAFFPMLLLEGLHLKVASVKMLSRRDAGRGRFLELGLMAAHMVAYVAVVASVMSLPVAIAFVAVQQGLFGLYLGLSFAPNHKGMPSLSEEEARDFLRRQVLTSRNVRGGRFVDNALGGLNYQIEHHLFPSMPRASLRRAQPIVRDFCAERGVSYTEESLIGSYRRALGHLHEVGAPLRAAREAGAAA